jgi:hypothetical protein
VPSLAHRGTFGLKVAPMLGLEETLEASSDSVQGFKVQSFAQADALRHHMVAYLSHSSQVAQCIKDEQFERNRVISDIQRLQELHLHLYEALAKDQFVTCWRELSQLQARLHTEIREMVAKPALHSQTMALTVPNQRLLGLRRKAMLRDDLIERLAASLRGRGALKPEDEELISGFSEA